MRKKSSADKLGEDKDGSEFKTWDADISITDTELSKLCTIHSATTKPSKVTTGTGSNKNKNNNNNDNDTDNAGNAVGDAMEDVGDAAGDVGKGVVDGVGEVGEGIKDAAKDMTGNDDNDNNNQNNDNNTRSGMQENNADDNRANR